MERPPDVFLSSPSSSKSVSRVTTRVFASALSSVIPGAGQFWLGNRLAGIGFFAVFFLLILMYSALRLPQWYFGIQFLIFAAIGLCTTASWHALRTPSQRTTQGSWWWLVMLLPFALLASFALSNFLLRKGGFRLFEVPSSGMEQTVFKGEEVIADLQAYRDSHPRERDVVILRKNNDFFMKRVTAVGGETVEGKDGTVFVNHQRQEEPYVQHIGGAPPELKDFGPVEVPRGELFVLGDNRDVSIDSRLQYFGLVAEGDVLGKPLYIIRSQRARIGKKIR